MNDATLLPRLDALFDGYRRSGAPGGCVAVARHGAPVWRSAFGMASLEQATAHLPTSRIAIGSVTKQLTAAAMLLLADEGVLSLDDPVGRWLPELQGDQRLPTLRQLMTHTGGVRCHLDLAIFSGDATMPTGHPMQVLQRQETLAFVPGTRASYSNGGYVLLSAVIERASGLPLETLLRTRLFEPIGMLSTELPRHRRASRQPGAAALHVATPEADDGWLVAPPLAQELLGEGGVVSTVDDLMRWAAWLRDPGSPVGIDRLACTVPLANGFRSDYGFGVVRESWRGIEIVNHVGGLPGGNAMLAMLPESGIDLALLFNRNVDVRALTLEVLDVLLGDSLAPLPARPRSADHGDLVGRYVAESPGFLLEFRDVGGELGLSVFGSSPRPLDARAADGGVLPFSAEVGLGEMRFRIARRGRGRVAVLEYSDSGTWHAAQRLDERPMSAIDFVRRVPQAFVGRDVEATLRFGVDGDALVVHLTGELGRSTCPAEMLGPDAVRFHDPRYASGPLARIERAEGGLAAKVIVSMARTPRIVFEPMR